MLKYSDELNDSKKIKTIVTNELSTVEERINSQKRYLEIICAHIDSSDNDSISSDLEKAKNQLESNLSDLEDISNTLNSFSSQTNISFEDTRKFNNAYLQIQKNINLANQTVLKYIKFNTNTIAKHTTSENTNNTQDVSDTSNDKIISDETIPTSNNTVDNIEPINDSETTPKNTAKSTKKKNKKKSLFSKKETPTVACEIDNIKKEDKSISENSSDLIENTNINLQENTSNIQKNSSKKIRKITNSSKPNISCYFAKPSSNTFVISTNNENFSIHANNGYMNFGIESKNFNITINNQDLEIVDSDRILLISYTDNSYIFKTNIEFKLPEFLEIKLLSKDKDFIEFTINNTTFGLCMEKGTLNFIDSNFTIPWNELQNIQQEPPIESNHDLIISEESDKIVLPFNVDELEKKVKENNKYSSIKELIEKEYIIPSSTFKSPIKSRFRESYRLIRKKEHGTVLDALSLAFELMFQSKLNPAIIAACKNLEELDIYLDCLEENELDKFYCFNIIYKISPLNQKNVFNEF